MKSSTYHSPVLAMPNSLPIELTINDLYTDSMAHHCISTPAAPSLRLPSLEPNLGAFAEFDCTEPRLRYSC